ncbi:MAG: DUF4136 domain-containing protein [Myxococcales bacterium]
MRSRIGPGLLATALALGACSTMKVESTAMPEAPKRLQSAHTYAWLPEPETGQAARDPFVRQTVKQSADRELSAKGFQRVEPGAHPDFLLGWYSTSQQVTEVEPTYRYYGGYGYPWGPYGGTMGPPDIQTMTEGTLVLDVVDPKSNQLLWRSDAKAELGDKPTTKDAEKKISEAIPKMLAEFPPKAGKAEANPAG